MRECPKCHKRFLESSARICDVDGAVLDLVVVASERDRLVGTTITNTETGQQWDVDKVLGDGGMGVVYRAVDKATGQKYAVKVLRAEYSAEEDLVLRFEQEARAAAAIDNPHIVEIYAWGSLPDNSRYFVMEYLEGRSLGDLLARMPKAPGADRRQPLPEDFALDIAMQITEGLAVAHEAGIVHRDIKPDNFHIVRKPENPYFVKILDFGIAKVQGSKAARTRTGSVFGTPHYMSPEQASGDKNIDDKTDIYGLGVLMYEMVVGKIPFDADNLMGILTAHLYHTPTPPSIYPECEKLSRSFEAVILKCLAKERDARYQSMRELYDDLARCRRGETSNALDDQEVNTARFDRMDFSSEAATVIRQLPPALMPASREELNAVLDLQHASGPPSAPHAAPAAMHSNSLPAPAPAGASPFDSVGRIQFSNGAPAPERVTGVSIPPGTEVPRPRNNTRIIVGAILGLGVTIAVAIVALASLQQPAPASPQPDPSLAVAQPALQPGRVLPTPSAPDAQPAAPAQPPQPAQAAVPHGVPAAQAEPVVIQSNVPGARVYRGGAQVGVTPHAVTRPAAGEESYSVVADGYVEQTVVVTGASTSPLVVTLAAAPPEDSRNARRPRRDRRERPQAQPRTQTPTQPRTQQPRRTGDLHDPWQ